MANSCTGDLGGICGGWHLSGVCMYVFLVIGTARGAAGRAFPAMLRARACKSRRCQFSVIFTGAADARKSSVGRSPFFQPRGSLFLCGSSLLLVPHFAPRHFCSVGLSQPLGPLKPHCEHSFSHLIAVTLVAHCDSSCAVPRLLEVQGFMLNF